MVEALSLLYRLHNKDAGKFHTNLIDVLIELRRSDVLLHRAIELDGGFVGVGGRLYALTMTEGVEAAIQDVHRHDLNRQGRALALGMAIMNLGRYEDALRLFEASLQQQHDASIQELANLLAGLDLHKLSEMDMTTPAGAASLFIGATVDAAGDRDFERIISAISPRRHQAYRSKPDVLLPLIRQFAHGLKMSRPLFLAAIAESLRQVEGDDSYGYRVTMEDETSELWRMHLERHQGGYVLVGITTADLGAAALARLERGDLQGALIWLDWAAKKVGGDNADPFKMPPLLHAWNRDVPRTAETARIAATVAMAMGPWEVSQIALRRLRQCKAHRANDRLRLACELALFRQALDNDRHQEAIAISAQWTVRFRESQAAIFQHTVALSQARQFDRAHGYLDAVAKRGQSDEHVLYLRCLVANQEGDVAAVIRYSRALLAKSEDRPVVWNGLAWALWIDGDPQGDAEAIARQAVAKNNRQEYAYLHTLAAILADSGRPEEALAVMHEANAERIEPLQDPDWLIVGLLAEAYGRDSDAIVAYRWLRRPTGAWSLSSYAVAQSRLRALLDNRAE